MRKKITHVVQRVVEDGNGMRPDGTNYTYPAICFIL